MLIILQKRELIVHVLHATTQLQPGGGGGTDV